MQQQPQRLQNPIPQNPKGLPPKQNAPSAAPKGIPSNIPNVPTFDVSDLEKKSPEELDALLRQMDDYAQQTKAVMQNFEEPEQKPQAKAGVKGIPKPAT